MCCYVFISEFSQLFQTHWGKLSSWRSGGWRYAQSPGYLIQNLGWNNLCVTWKIKVSSTFQLLLIFFRFCLCHWLRPPYTVRVMAVFRGWHARQKIPTTSSRIPRQWKLVSSMECKCWAARISSSPRSLCGTSFPLSQKCYIIQCCNVAKELLKLFDRTAKLEVSSPSKSALPHLGRALTDIQELKQVSCLTVFWAVPGSAWWGALAYMHIPLTNIFDISSLPNQSRS